jgi:hypothetical protein
MVNTHFPARGRRGRKCLVSSAGPIAFTVEDLAILLHLP